MAMVVIVGDGGRDCFDRIARVLLDDSIPAVKITEADDDMFEMLPSLFVHQGDDGKDVAMRVLCNWIEELIVENDIHRLVIAGARLTQLVVQFAMYLQRLYGVKNAKEINMSRLSPETKKGPRLEIVVQSELTGDLECMYKKVCRDCLMKWRSSQDVPECCHVPEVSYADSVFQLMEEEGITVERVCSELNYPCKEQPSDSISKVIESVERRTMYMNELAIKRHILAEETYKIYHNVQVDSEQLEGMANADRESKSNEALWKLQNIFNEQDEESSERSAAGTP